MLKRALALVFLVAFPVAVWAMSASSVPQKFPVPFANSASCGINYSSNCYITKPFPTTSQIGVTNCAASLPDGFPPLTWPVAGGCPPFGQDFNGILYQLSAWGQWQGAGATVQYDSGFSTSIGGYPKGAILQQAAVATCFWISQVDNNSSDPDTGGANWTPSCPGGGVGGASTEIGGNPNQQAVTVAPFAVYQGVRVSYTSGFTNTGPLKVNVNGAGLTNVYRLSQLGSTMSVGGETVANQRVTLEWDGSEWQCVSCAYAMVGEVKHYEGSTAPAGWAFEDGSCISQTTYADLFSVSGSAFGTCGAGNFALQDLRGRVEYSQDTQGVNGAANRLTTAGSSCNGAVIGTTCGSQNVTLTQPELPNVAVPLNGTTQTWATNETNIWQGASALISPGGAADTFAALAAAHVTITPAGTTAINGGVTQVTTPTVQNTQINTTIVKL